MSMSISYSLEIGFIGLRHMNIRVHDVEQGCPPNLFCV